MTNDSEFSKLFNDGPTLNYLTKESLINDVPLSYYIGLSTLKALATGDLLLHSRMF